MQKASYLTKSSKLLKFVGAGIINTGVDWAVFYFASEVLLTGDIVAKIWGTVAGVTSAFLLSAFWVFKQSFMPVLKEANGTTARLQYILGKYFQTIGAYAAGMLLNVGVFYVLSAAGVISIVALAAATGCSFIVNFLLADKLVFKPVK